MCFKADSTDNSDVEEIDLVSTDSDKDEPLPWSTLRSGKNLLKRTIDKRRSRITGGCNSSKDEDDEDEEDCRLKIDEAASVTEHPLPPPPSSEEETGQRPPKPATISVIPASELAESGEARSAVSFHDDSDITDQDVLVINTGKEDLFAEEIDLEEEGNKEEGDVRVAIGTGLDVPRKRRLEGRLEEGRSMLLQDGLDQASMSIVLVGLGLTHAIVF